MTDPELDPPLPAPTPGETVAAPEPVSEPHAAPERPTIADGERHELEPEQIVVERIGGWIAAAVVGGGSLVTLVLAWILGWFAGWLVMLLAPVWLLLVAGLVWLAQRWPVLEHSHTHWRVSETGMDIWKGVVWRRVISVPRSRVQHTDVTQGPLQRRYDLATLSLHTAGTEHAKVDLEGLSHATALRVRDFLLVREEDDVV